MGNNFVAFLSCACVSDDEYECWAVRHGLGMSFTCRAIDDDGGPCECSCHKDEDETDFYADDLCHKGE